MSVRMKATTVDEDGRVCTHCLEWIPYVDPETGKPNFWRRGDEWRAECIPCAQAARGQIELPTSLPQRTCGIWTCIKDPTPGGVWRGGRHNMMIFRMTLNSGYFPEGLVFRSPDGKLFRITGEECYPQELEAIT